MIVRLWFSDVITLSVLHPDSDVKTAEIELSGRELFSIIKNYKRDSKRQRTITAMDGIKERDIALRPRPVQMPAYGRD